MLFFFFKQKTAYEMRISDWSSDVCSSDLGADVVRVRHTILHEPHRRGLEFAIGLFEAGGEIGERPVLGGGAFAIDDREKCLHRAAAILGELAADKVHPLAAVGAFIGHGEERKDVVWGKGVVVRVEFGGGRIRK